MRILSDKKGITLSELLATTAIVVLIFASVSLMIKVSTETYKDSVSMSESRMLCSTLTSVIADELRYAGTVTTDHSGNLVSFFSRNYGSDGASTFETNGDGQLTLGGEELLSKSAYVYNTRARVKVKFIDGVFRVELTVTNGGGDVMVKNNFEVMPLNDPA